MTERARCSWCNGRNPLYVQYHDCEWGVPEHDDGRLFELLVLEPFQAGLAWETILNKREAFRTAFDGFDAGRIAAYTEADVERLMADKGIIRNRRKIEAAICNAQVFLRIQAEYGSFDAYIWRFTGGEVIHEIGRTHSALSDTVAKDLKARGMKFIGTTIVYSYLQAIGVLYSHEPGCFLHRKG